MRQRNEERNSQRGNERDSRQRFSSKNSSSDWRGREEGYDRENYGNESYQQMNERNYRDDRNWGNRGYSTYSPGQFGEPNRTDYERQTYLGSNDRWGTSYSGGNNSGQHFGKGPKGYTRSDDRIREDVCEALSRHDEIDASEIEVDVENGEVSLTGMVEDRRIKRMAEECIQDLSGVRDVSNRLRIGQGSSSKESESKQFKGRAA